MEKYKSTDGTGGYVKKVIGFQAIGRKWLPSSQLQQQVLTGQEQHDLSGPPSSVKCCFVSASSQTQSLPLSPAEKGIFCLQGLTKFT